MFTMIALSALVLLFLTVLLPLVTFARVVGLTRDLERLRARLAALEASPRGQTAGGAAPVIASAPSSPPADALVTRPREEPPRDAPRAAPAPPVISPPPVIAPPAPALTPLRERASAARAAPAPERPRSAAVMDDGWLEEAIGGRLLLYVGTAAVVLGLAFFLKYAFDRAWITEWMRVALGAGAGLALVAAGLRFAGRGYVVYGQILAGGGLATLYLSVYAAFDFYALIGRTTAFGLLVGVTVAAAGLSDRQRSQGMALMAVGGGFLTPFLVGGSQDAQITLFSYIALLVAGTLYLSNRRQWPLLNIVSFALTVLTIDAWASVHYTPAKFLRTQLFLTLFCAMFLVVLRDTWRSRGAEGGNASTGPIDPFLVPIHRVDVRSLAAILLLLAPVLYHLASLAVLFPHGIALLVYLIAFTVVAVAWSVRAERAWLGPLFWAAAMLPLFGWIGGHAAPRWILPVSVTLGAIFALHLLAQFDRLVRQGVRPGKADLLLFHLNGLGLFVGFYLLLEPVALAWVPSVGALLVAVHAIVTWQLRERDETAALHALAVTFALLAATVTVEFDGAWLTAALAAEGAAVMWVGRRARAEWFGAGGIALMAVACARWLLLSLTQTPATFELVLNEAFLLGAWVIALLYVSAWLHRDDPRRLATLLVTASALTVVLLTQQNASYWELRRPTNANAMFAEGLSLSLIWVLYAAVLIVAGIARRYAPLRYTAIALFGITILKVFLVDLSDLEGIYRIVGLIIVGGVLLAVSFLYQRMVGSSEAPAEGEPAS